MRYVENNSSWQNKQKCTMMMSHLVSRGWRGTKHLDKVI